MKREAFNEYMRQRRQALRRFTDEYKMQRGCKTCGEKHPACLDFHHREPEQKAIQVSKAIVNGWTQRRLLTEIEKCDILCANCHRKQHWPGMVVVV